MYLLKVVQQATESWGVLSFSHTASVFWLSFSSFSLNKWILMWCNMTYAVYLRLYLPNCETWSGPDDCHYDLTHITLELKEDELAFYHDSKKYKLNNKNQNKIFHISPYTPTDPIVKIYSIFPQIACLFHGRFNILLHMMKTDAVM